MLALFVDSMSTCRVSEDDGTIVGYDPTIRLDCNLVARVHLTAEPLVHITERFLSSLMLELVIQGFFVMANYHVSEHSNKRFAEAMKDCE